MLNATASNKKIHSTPAQALTLTPDMRNEQIRMPARTPLRHSVWRAVPGAEFGT